MTTSLEETTMTVSKKLREQVAAAGAEFAAVNQQRAKTVAACKKLALRAHAAGMPETELAELFGVDRARTIRRWLGKA